MPNKEDQIMNLQRLLKATQTSINSISMKSMDNLEKATQMARINLMLKIKNQNSQKEKLTQLALEQMEAGNDKSQIVQILAIRENLTPAEQRALEAILFQLF
jgi:hypothetical protein